LAEIARKSLAENFRNIDPAKTRVLLVEAGPSILTRIPRTFVAARLNNYSISASKSVPARQ